MNPTPDGFAQALALFRKAAASVPAYKQFLVDQQVDPASIKSFSDWQKLPPVTKDNYLKKYRLKDLLWDGQTTEARTISMSSGSSGQPFFWFRGNQSVTDSLAIVDEAFNQTFATREKETLVIIAFAMGTWIAGTYMYTAMLGLADQGHRLTTITPGINKEEILRIIQKIGDQFEQILIMGYPPFVKDVVDFAHEQGVDLSRLRLKLLYAGENYSEKWRDYMLRQTGQTDELRTMIAIYGTADAGIMAMESPFTVYVRRLADQNELLRQKLFPNCPLLPTLVAYQPELRFTEEVDGNIVFTVNTSMPLIRYNILDQGRVLTSEEAIASVQALGLTIPADLLPMANRPMIALYGRPDVATMFYALNIYPENIKYGLEAAEFSQSLTGKFVVKTLVVDDTQEQHLQLRVELKPSVMPTDDLRQRVFQAVVASLRANNSEYNKLYQEIGVKAEPAVELVGFGDPAFKINIKHKWVAKS